ncbi:MAG: hypothetical protein ACREIT_09580 [Tepidisphaeraceae bacterium]
MRILHGAFHDTITVVSWQQDAVARTVLPARDLCGLATGGIGDVVPLHTHERDVLELYLPVAIQHVLPVEAVDLAVPGRLVARYFAVADSGKIAAPKRRVRRATEVVLLRIGGWKVEGFEADVLRSGEPLDGALIAFFQFLANGASPPAARLIAPIDEMRPLVRSARDVVVRVLRITRYLELRRQLAVEAVALACRGRIGIWALVGIRQTGSSRRSRYSPLDCRSTSPFWG